MRIYMHMDKVYYISYMYVCTNNYKKRRNQRRLSGKGGGNQRHKK